MVHGLAPMVMEFALRLMQSNANYKDMRLDDVIGEVLGNMASIGSYFEDQVPPDAEEPPSGTRH